MKKFTLVFTLVFFMIVFCIVMCDNPYLIISKPIKFKDKISQLNFDWTVNEIGSLASNDFSKDADLKDVVNFKLLSSRGRLVECSMEEAINVHLNNVQHQISYQLKKQPSNLPIFEIKDSPEVIIAAYGNGLWGEIWALVLLDKETLEIRKVLFDHKGESPALGAEIADGDFNLQFIGSYLNPDSLSISFGLFQNESSILSGKHAIEGITGATVTSLGAVEMMNRSGANYQDYLSGNTRD